MKIKKIVFLACFGNPALDNLCKSKDKKIEDIFYVNNMTRKASLRKKHDRFFFDILYVDDSFWTLYRNEIEALEELRKKIDAYHKKHDISFIIAINKKYRDIFMSFFSEITKEVEKFDVVKPFSDPEYHNLFIIPLGFNIGLKKGKEGFSFICVPVEENDDLNIGNTFHLPLPN